MNEVSLKLTYVESFNLIVFVAMQVKEFIVSAVVRPALEASSKPHLEIS